MRLRKKNSKKPGAILFDKDVFGEDLFINSMSEFCIEILNQEGYFTSKILNLIHSLKKIFYPKKETKTNKNQTSVYLRQWSPTLLELGDLVEVIVNGNSLDLVLNEVIIKKYFFMNE
jgi:hypothetical protein